MILQKGLVKKVLLLEGVFFFWFLFFCAGAEARRNTLYETRDMRHKEEEGRTERGRRSRVSVEEVLLWQKADRAFMVGQYAQALECYEALLKNYPRTSYQQQAVYRQGLCCLKTNSFAQARECFNSLLGISKRASRVDQDQVQLSLADSYFGEEDIENAFLEYRKVMVNYPSSPYMAAVYYKLGECSRKQGRWSEARYYFQKISQEYPLSFEAKQMEQLLLNEAFSFEIQVGSFKDKKNADELCNQLLGEGYQAYVSCLTASGKTLYRVRVGKFDSRPKAEFCEKKLKKEGFPTNICP